jgi:hemerythrin-like domain-containing protein
MTVEPLEILKREHAVILRVVALLEADIARLDRGLEFDMALARWAVGFFERFVHACHHAKEETALFPVLEQRGIPRHGGPIGVMRREHEEGRECVHRMARAAGERDERAFSAAASRYCALLRQHISKENDVLFEIARMRLGPADAGALVQAFERVEREKGGLELHQRLHAELERWEQEAAGERPHAHAQP